MSSTSLSDTAAATAPLRRTQPVRHLALAALLTALSLLVVLAALAVRQHLQAGRAGNQALQAQQAVAEMAGLQSVLTDAELPGSMAALPAARQQADAHMAALRTLLSPDAEQYARLVPLGALLSARFDALAMPADPRQRPAAPPVDAARQQAPIRSALAELRATALAHSAAQQQRASTSAAWATACVLAGGAAALAMLLAGWALLQRQGRQLAAALAQRSNDGQRAQQATQALQTLLDMAPDAICHVDAEGRISRSNAACTTLWARPPTDLAGLPLTELIAPEDQRKAAQMLAAAARPGAAPATCAARCKQPDGSVLPMAWTALARSDDRSNEGRSNEGSSSRGGSSDGGVWCIAQDRSPQAAAAAQLAARDTALREAQACAAQADARAAAADAVKASLLASTGPALRAPVDAILSFAGMLHNGLAGALDAGQRRQVAQLRGHAQQLLRTVNNMLDITQLEAGDLPLAHEAFDLLESVQTVASTARVHASDKGLKLDLDMAPDLGYARGDAARFEQILHNLLDNAVRATAAGNIRLQAAPQADGTLRISVQDSGVGMDAAAVARLFQPFAMAAGGGTSSTGMGLGLALSQGLAQRMGGSISAKSAPGQGSTFVLTLPADLVAQQ